MRHPNGSKIKAAKLQRAVVRVIGETLPTKAVVNILYTASWLEGINIQRFKPHGISPQQYNVLRILRGAYPNPVMLGEITERMIDKNSNATRLVEKLRLKGFLKRDICKTNRRQVDITITQKGLTLLET